MSPLTEKLAAILDEWDHVSGALTDLQQQCSSKDSTILGLQQTIASQQQQLNRQASELGALKNQYAALQSQATAALLTSADPDDARLKKRIDAAYEAMATQKPLPIASGLPGNQIAPSPTLLPGSAPTRPATPNSFSETSVAPQGAERMAVSVAPVRLVPASPGGSRAGNAAITNKPSGNGLVKPQPQPVSVSMGK